MPLTLDWVFLHEVAIETPPTDLTQTIPQEPSPSNLYMALMPALKRQRQADRSLVYIMSSKAASATQLRPKSQYTYFFIYMFKIVPDTETKLVKMHKLQRIMLRTLLKDVRELINGDTLCVCEDYI